MKRTSTVLSLLILASSHISVAQDNYSSMSKPDSKPSILGALVPKPQTKEQVLGKLFKTVLEKTHITKKELNDSVSRNALKLYIERIDYGKQFLIREDIENLNKYKNDLDNQVESGELKLIALTDSIMKKRIPMLEKYVKAILKKNFDFTKDEEIETDAKKRKFVKNIGELKKRWHNLIKFEFLNQYLELVDEQNEDPAKKNKDKKKIAKKKTATKTKKLSKKELLDKTREKLTKRYKRVFKRLKEERESDKLDKFYNSIAGVFDPHSHYFVPEEKEDFDIEMSGKLEGIGALLEEEGSFIKVKKIIPGSASWKAKELKAEDTILAVSQDNKEFVDIVDMGIRDAVKLIRGKKGTPVYLKVKKTDGVSTVYKIVRDKVVLEDSYVKASVLKSKKLGVEVGYINVPKFYRDFQDDNGRNSSEDVKKELIRLNKTKAKAVILDLRNNGGGALIDATLMGGLFVDSGPMVQVKDSGAPEVNYDTDGKTYWDKPLVVLINRFSASASEIVAGAMKDYKRAVIVGSSEQTHGKGTVQYIRSIESFLSNPFAVKRLGPLGAIKVTNQMFYRINGMSTQFRGVVPDIELPDAYGFLESGEKSLDYAIPYASVEPVKFKVWNKTNYNLSKLKRASKARVKKNKLFQQIKESVDWSKKRKEETERSLVMSDMEKYRKQAKVISDKYDKIIDEIHGEKTIEDMTVTSMKKLKTKVDKERFQEFRESLQKDPVVEESLNIIKDMLKS